MFDIDQFRQEFKQFSDTEKWPDDCLYFWGDLADAQVCDCGSTAQKKVFLLTAHFLECADKSGFFNAAGTSNNSSSNSGGIAQKTVGPITISYDTGANRASEYSDAGMLNSTRWGRIYLQLTQHTHIGALIV